MTVSTFRPNYNNFNDARLHADDEIQEKNVEQMFLGQGSRLSLHGVLDRVYHFQFHILEQLFILTAHNHRSSST